MAPPTSAAVFAISRGVHQGKHPQAMAVRIGHRKRIAEIHIDRRLQYLDTQGLPVGKDCVDRRLVRLGESNFSAAARGA